MRLTLLAIIGLLSASRSGMADSSADLEFFEKKIRPLLSTHCYECHGERKAQANLRLDHAEGWERGGDTGPALVPGKPQESLLWRALAHDGELDMPPQGKLPEEEIALVAEWIARGAPAPATPAEFLARRTNDIAVGRQWWSYQPIQEPGVPLVPDRSWPDNPIDCFVRQDLDRSALPPQPDAERGVLLRRLAIDLLGMPPDIDDLEAFRSAREPDAYERIIDRYLASPRFGERWARHWLDVVRFAESLTLRGFVLPQAWRYRDYVFDAFNLDRPLADFLREQIAGDLLPAESLPDRQRQLVATTFWTLGNTNLEEQDKKQLDLDVVDEQIDVMGKAMLAQTIGCARCHDHKFDPIPARDYYALAGILANTKMLEHENVSRWTEIPLPTEPHAEAQYAEWKQEEEQLQARASELRKSLDKQTGDPSILDPKDLPGLVIDDEQAEKVGPWTNSRSNKPYIGSGYVHDSDAAKGDKTISFVAMLPSDGRYEVRLAYSAGSNRASSVPVTVFSAEGEKTFQIDMKAKPPIDGRFLSLGEYRFESAGQSYLLISNEGTQGHVTADAVQFLPVGPGTTASPAPVPAADSSQVRELKRELLGTEKRLREMSARLASRPRVMTIVERPKMGDSPLFLRGSVHQPGEIVPRGFLQVVPPTLTQPISANESGRRALADWITSPDNPLPARVYANRLWAWIFGVGIVPSVDNFGTTGEKPTHPELLDYLSMRLLDSDGSSKSLLRLMVESRTYRQTCSSIHSDVNPGNRLLSGMRIRRLDAETIRDTMLVASGELQSTIGGTTIKEGTVADYGYKDQSMRRSLYVPVMRNALPDFQMVFDFPDPSLVTGERTSSTIAPQALYLMNHPFVMERAQETARQILKENTSLEGRLQWVFERILSRPPTEGETELMREVLRSAPDPSAGWRQVVQLLFESIDFRFYR